MTLYLREAELLVYLQGEIKKRFSQETVEKLTQPQWWNRSGQWLWEHVDKFCDVNMLLKDI